MGIEGVAMSSCPFWSTNKEKISCYYECPMNDKNNKREMCPFKEIISEDGMVSFGKNINDDMFYSQDRYSGYNENNDTVLSY